MKTLAILLFIAVSIFGFTKASAGPLTELEITLLQTHILDESARPAVKEAYWADIDGRVKETRADLPTQVHPAVILVGIIYDGETGITYTYFVNNPNFDLDIVKKNLLGVICGDPQVSLMLNTFGGKIDYVHFLANDLSKVWDEFSIDASDCGAGI